MNFCGECGTKLVSGACAGCTAKSTSGLSAESLEKSLAALEDLSKGVRPAEAASKEEDNKEAKELVSAAVKQAKKYGAKGEGESEEEPKTKRGVESAIKGFMPPEEEEEEEDPRKRREEEEEAEEAGMGGGEPEFKSAKKKAKKSFADELVEQEPVRKAVDVSEFLESLVYQLGDYTDSLRDDVNKSLKFGAYQQKYNVGLAKALGEIGTLLKGLTEQVAVIGKTPASVRKSDQSAVVIEKSFAGNNANANNNLSKSEIAQKLMALMESGDKSVEGIDIIRAESTGLLKPEHRTKLGLDSQQ